MPSIAEEAEAVVKSAVARFDFGDYLGNGGIVFAEKQVILFTDMAAGLEIPDLTFKINQIKDSYAKDVGGVPTDNDELNELNAKRNALINRKWDTRIEVVLTTVAPKMLNSIQKASDAKKKANSWTEEERGEYFMQEFLRNTFKSIKIIKLDKVIDGPLNVAEYLDFMESLPETEVEKIVATGQMLTYAVRMLDDEVDAGFPGGSPDEAGELQPLPPD